MFYYSELDVGFHVIRTITKYSWFMSFRKEQLSITSTVEKMISFFNFDHIGFYRTMYIIQIYITSIQFIKFYKTKRQLTHFFHPPCPASSTHQSVLCTYEFFFLIFSSSSPLFAVNLFQDPQWMLEIMNSTELYIYYAFLVYIYVLSQLLSHI